MQKNVVSIQHTAEDKSSDNNKKGAIKNRVVACIDGSHFNTVVCDYACWISSKVGAPLKLLHSNEQHSVPSASAFSGSIGLGNREHLLEEFTAIEQERSKLLVASGWEILNHAKERAIAAGIEDIIIQQRHGPFTSTLSELEKNVRVVVMGIRGEDHEYEADQISTHIETIVRTLHSPILIVNDEFQLPKKIMLAYDGSEPSEKALNMVAQSLLFKDLPCYLVHVNNGIDDGDEILEYAANKLRKSGLEVVAEEIKGKVVDALCEYRASHDIDMTVMGAFRHTRVRNLLLGSFTEKMLARTQKPLLLLR